MTTGSSTFGGKQGKNEQEGIELGQFAPFTEGVGTKIGNSPDYKRLAKISS